MHGRTTFILLAAVATLGIYIQVGERNRESQEQRRANTRLALRFEPDLVTNIRINTPAGMFTLEQTNGAWRMTSPSRGPADGNAILRLLDTMAALRRSEIITEEEQRTLGLDPAEYGFAPPRAHVTMEFPDRSMTLLIGRDAPGGDQVYLMLEGQRDILVTGRDLIAALPGGQRDLRDRRLFPSQPGRIRRIEIDARDRTFHATRIEDEQWIIERPAPSRGANAEIRQWLDRLYEFRIVEFVADSVAAASLYGFEEPFIQVALSTDPKSLPHILKVGRPADANNQAYYAMVVGQEAVFTIDQAAVEWLRHDPGEFRDPRVMTIPAAAINHIQMTDGDRILVLQRTTHLVWEVVSPKKLAADDRRVQQLLGAWTGARAIRFLDPPFSPETSAATPIERRSILFARSPRPLVASGNATNASSVTTDNDVLITLAAESPAGQLLVTASPFPSLLEVNAALAQEISVNPMTFRETRILAIDGSQIRRITQRIGTHEISVERTNALFRALSTREVPDTDAIDTVIDSVSRLRATRFVAEDPRDLAAYGLESPERQLILSMTSGDSINRVLAFGHSEHGETFALLQGSDTVFTLPDDRVERLMKPVANPLAPVTTPSESP